MDNMQLIFQLTKRFRPEDRGVNSDFLESPLVAWQQSST